MAAIETQGLSHDYQSATGMFESISRGEMTRSEILNILRHVATLEAPDGDDTCPPTVNTMLDGEIYTCFHGGGGTINCLDSQEQTMTPEIAAAIICGEMTIEQYDLSKGHRPRRGINLLVIGVVALTVIVIYLAMGA